MSWIRRTFSSAYRRARRAEARGEYREAAASYAEADAHDEAANALLFLAARTHVAAERMAAFQDALRWLPPNHPRHDEVQAHIGMAILDEAQRRGVRTAEEQAELLDGARRLEGAGRFAEAATAFQLLERQDDVIRCLQNGGEVERLEALLEATQAEAKAERDLRKHVRDYEAAMVVGQRREARTALLAALRAAEADGGGAELGDLRDLLRRLESRQLPACRCTLVVDGRRQHFAGEWPVSFGREGDVVVRGTGVSRKHAELDVSPEGWVVRDLGSRNGTLLRGVPIAGEARVAGATRVGLGDHVVLTIEPTAGGARVEVEAGLDAGAVAVVGEGDLPLSGAGATVRFDDGQAVLASPRELRLGQQPCVMPIELLRDDVIYLGQTKIEVA